MRTPAIRTSRGRCSSATRSDRRRSRRRFLDQSRGGRPLRGDPAVPVQTEEYIHEDSSICRRLLVAGLLIVAGCGSFRARRRRYRWYRRCRHGGQRRHRQHRRLVTGRHRRRERFGAARSAPAARRSGGRGGESGGAGADGRGGTGGGAIGGSVGSGGASGGSGAAGSGGMAVSGWQPAARPVAALESRRTRRHRWPGRRQRGRARRRRRRRHGRQRRHGRERRQRRHRHRHLHGVEGRGRERLRQRTAQGHRRDELRTPGSTRAPSSGPTDLGGTEKYPIFVWGEGGCSLNGLSNSAAMGEIASHGYFVIADGTPNGSGSRSMTVGHRGDG